MRPHQRSPPRKACCRSLWGHRCHGHTSDSQAICHVCSQSQGFYRSLALGCCSEERSSTTGQRQQPAPGRKSAQQAHASPQLACAAGGEQPHRRLEGTPAENLQPLWFGPKQSKVKWSKKEKVKQCINSNQPHSSSNNSNSQNYFISFIFINRKEAFILTEASLHLKLLLTGRGYLGG